MPYYITYGEFQHYLKEYFFRTGSRMQFPEMADYLYRKGLLSTEYPHDLSVNKIFTTLSDEEFDKAVDSFVISLNPRISVTSQVWEGDIIPLARDVYIIRHPRYTRPYMHMHNYFEIDFVVSGECDLSFENEKRVLKAGELCIIAPTSRHDLVINDDDSFVFCIMIRKSTFNTTFFSLMSQKNLLSYFFRTVLQGDSHSNYLLFYSDDILCLKNIAMNAMGECYKQDAFSNNNVISFINLFFSYLLRSYSDTIQFYNYQLGTDFTLILQYIQHNYQRLTLSALAEFFHYSEPHISTQIKQYTGYNFTTLIKQLRMADAVSYLTNTEMKVNEIAECIGYNSADHFSRVFRSEYKMSPQEYRKRHQEQKDQFHPMEQN